MVSRCHWRQQVETSEREREGGRGLAVTPHSLLGCQNERGEAGQRLGQFQEWMLQRGTFFFFTLLLRNTTQHRTFTSQPSSLLPAAVLCLTLVSPRPSPNNGTGRLGKQAIASLDSEAQGSHSWQLNTAPTTSITTQSYTALLCLRRSIDSKSFQKI